MKVIVLALKYLVWWWRTDTDNPSLEPSQWESRGVNYIVQEGLLTWVGALRSLPGGGAP